MGADDAAARSPRMTTAEQAGISIREPPRRRRRRSTQGPRSKGRRATSNGHPRPVVIEKSRAVHAPQFVGLDHLVGGRKIPGRHRHRSGRARVYLAASAWEAAMVAREQHQRPPAFRDDGQGHVLDQPAVERRTSVAAGHGKYGRRGGRLEGRVTSWRDTGPFAISCSPVETASDSTAYVPAGDEDSFVIVAHRRVRPRHAAHHVAPGRGSADMGDRPLVRHRHVHRQSGMQLRIRPHRAAACSAPPARCP